MGAYNDEDGLEIAAESEKVDIREKSVNVVTIFLQRDLPADVLHLVAIQCIVLYHFASFLLSHGSSSLRGRLLGYSVASTISLAG